MLTCCWCVHRRVFDGSSPYGCATGEPMLSSHRPEVYQVLVSSWIAQQLSPELACHFNSLPRISTEHPYLTTQPYGRMSSWHRQIPCSNLLGKHDKAPLLCPVLGLICRGRTHTADSRRRAVGKEPRNGRGWTHPSSPCAFQGNVEFNTISWDLILGETENACCNSDSASSKQVFPARQACHLSRLCTAAAASR